METLKKLFPYSFKKKGDVGALIVNILIQLLIGAVATVLISILAKLPIIGIIISLVGGLVNLYVLAGIIISILDYNKILK